MHLADRIIQLAYGFVSLQAFWWLVAKAVKTGT